MSRFEITESTGYSSSWIVMALLFVAGIVIWLAVSALAALMIALIGIATAAFFRLRGRKRIGDHLELNDRGMVFCEAGELRCIAFNEIKIIKRTRHTPWGEESFLIETRIGNKKSLNPQDYEQWEQLRERLLRSFAEYECRMLQ